MFYATQVKSVSGGSAVDVNGRILQFIGYMHIKAGDTVYTDGRFIFGNAPPKGGSVLIDEPKGIPVLGESDLNSEELRGYFTTKGKYKKFKIAGNDWITNDKTKYIHDSERDIIDAEISEDGEVYTVEKKVNKIDKPDDAKRQRGH